jgi:uncharacterized protein (DUF433 family)
MKNLHLVPVNVQDIVEKMMDGATRENERMQYVLRVEAIRDFCAEAIRRQENKISAQKKFVRK